MSRWRVAGLVFVFLWFALGGVAHFVATEAEMRIVPPRAAVLVSGVFELLGAAGLLWQPTRRAAGIGLFLLTLAVTPAHFYMLQRPELFPSVPYWALVVRLPVQVALLALIAQNTELTWSLIALALKILSRFLNLFVRLIDLINIKSSGVKIYWKLAIVSAFNVLRGLTTHIEK